MSSHTNNTPNDVNLNELSELSGVPLDFIKNELMLSDDQVSVESLRSKMLSLLDSTFLKEA